MRVHILAAFAVSLVGSGIPLGLAEKVTLIFCVLLVFFAEIINSALEQLVDLATQEFDEKAKIAKDAAAAAVLVLGLGLGRMSNEPARLPTARVEAPAPGTPMTGDAYRVAVAQHLTRTETLLTSFRAEAAGGTVDDSAVEWAGQMLSTTRLLLDSPAADDPRLRTLLEDLELVLAQIAALPTRPDTPSTTHTEVDLARRAVEEKQLLPRMQTLAPAGSPVTLGES
jgi:hypothetical protein